MFVEIEALAVDRGSEMTCYVDDLVFTGPGATRRLIYDVIQVVRHYRLWGHKTKVFKAGQPKVITGVAVTRFGGRLPNKRQKVINDELSLLASATADNDRLTIMRRLLGRMYEAAQVDRSWMPRAEALAGQKRGLERRISRN